LYGFTMQSGNKNLAGVSFTLVCVFLLLSTSIVSLGFLKISFAQTSPPPGQPVIQNRTIDLVCLHATLHADNQIVSAIDHYQATTTSRQSCNSS
jgi:hypothetical protein